MTITTFPKGHYNKAKKIQVTREDLTWAEFIEQAKKTPDYGDGGDDWAGGRMRDLNKWLDHGDLENAKKAQEMLDEINTGLDLSLLGPEWSLSPVGGTVSVGAFLAGSPASMRRMVDVESDRAPINLYVGVGYSASYSADQIMQRGLACLALAMALSRVRPVKLWAYVGLRPGYGDDNGEFVTAFEVPINDVGAAATVLTRAVILRQYGFSRMKDALKLDEKPWSICWPNHTEMEYMQPKGDDVLVPHGHRDEQDVILKNPVKWVETQIRKAINHEGLVASTYRNDGE